MPDVFTSIPNIEEQMTVPLEKNSNTDNKTIYAKLEDAFFD